MTYDTFVATHEYKGQYNNFIGINKTINNIAYETPIFY